MTRLHIKINSSFDPFIREIHGRLTENPEVLWVLSAHVFGHAEAVGEQVLAALARLLDAVQHLDLEIANKGL